MTQDELRQSLNMVLTNYNKPVDVNIMTLWTGLYIDFNAELFREACLEVIAANKYFPKASEIIDSYQLVREKIERERYERLKREQRLLSSGQKDCYLCGNSGYCTYIVSDNEYAARCICSHGKDLNKFSESCIQRECIPEIREYYTGKEKDSIKNGRNPFYLPTIKEVLGKEFEVYEARKKESYLSRNGVTDKEKIEILRFINNG